MSVGLRTERCEDCGHQVPAFDTIDLTVSPKQSRRICARCFNALIAKRAGVRFEHPDFAPIVLQDAAGAPHEQLAIGSALATPRLGGRGPDREQVGARRARTHRQ